MGEKKSPAIIIDRMGQREETGKKSRILLYERAQHGQILRSPGGDKRGAIYVHFLLGVFFYGHVRMRKRHFPSTSFREENRNLIPLDLCHRKKKKEKKFPW